MRLLIEEAGRPPREIEAVVGLTIGRGPTNNCELTDDAASSKHARIVSLEGRLAIEDVGSTNGTWTEGGEKLERGVPLPLDARTKLMIGRTSIRVLVPAPPPAPAPAPGAARQGDQKNPRAARDPFAGASSRGPDATLPPVAAGAPTTAGDTIPPGSDPGSTLPPSIPTVPPQPAQPAPPKVTNRPAAPPPSPPKGSARPPAPAVPATPPRTSSPPSVSADGGTIDGTLQAGGGAMDETAVRAHLNALEPRLVFVAHKVGRAERLSDPETKVGRRKSSSVAIGLEDLGVSSPHATFHFDGQEFYVEDLESSNGTWVADAKLAARAGRTVVRCDQRVRLGTVDVLFLHEPLAGSSDDRRELYVDALAILQRSPGVSQDKLREAKRRLEAGEHPGEFLVLDNALGVAPWCEAVETARLQRRLRGKDKSKALVWAVIAVLLAGAGVAAMIYLR